MQPLGLALEAQGKRAEAAEASSIAEKANCDRVPRPGDTMNLIARIIKEKRSLEKRLLEFYHFAPARRMPR